ncbi:MAG: hypothetical protein RIC15_02925 [Vicingaceae bacterium]
MKKFIYLLPFLIAGLMACGGGETDSESEDTQMGEADQAIKGVETDLSDYGMPYTITIPDGQAELIIEAFDWGGVQIARGENFIMSIAYGEGDIDILKFDMEEDLIYKSEILEEGDNYIMYKREIPDSGMEPEYHFMYVDSGPDEAIEITNSKDVNYGEEAIRKMLASAKTFKAKAGA